MDSSFLITLYEICVELIPEFNSSLVFMWEFEREQSPMAVGRISSVDEPIDYAVDKRIHARTR
jgi:hypothetical protein